MSQPHQDWKVVVLKKNNSQKEKQNKQQFNGKVTTNGNSAIKVYDSNDPDAEPEYKPKMVDLQFKDQIIKARNAKGLTQKQLAEALSIPVKVINEYEAGTGIHNGNYVSKIKKYLNITKNTV